MRMKMGRSFPFLIGAVFFSSCATVTLPIAVTLPPAVDLSPYHEFAFGEINGNIGQQFKGILMTELSRSQNFRFVSHDQLNILAAEYDLAKSNSQFDSKTKELELEMEGTGFISGTVNKDYYESMREQPDTCEWKNQAVTPIWPPLGV